MRTILSNEERVKAALSRMLVRCSVDELLKTTQYVAKLLHHERRQTVRERAA